MLRNTLLVLAIASALAACSKEAKDPAKPDGKAEGKASASAKDTKPSQLLVAPQDLLTVSSDSLASGPVITGSIQPERRADLRAEVSSVVLQVFKENGEPVKRGDLLVKLDETAIRDTLLSADAGVRAAGQALDQANRQLERLKTLRASGMTSVAAQDEAEVRRNTAQSELSAAKSRAALARQQSSRTQVRAPFDGIVSDRKVSAGDTATVGKELVKVIDPTSMRFEGRVSTDKISTIKVGQPVKYHINGYGAQQFTGVVKRIDASANDITRQVEVLVGLTGEQPRVAGLYAEGRIDAERSTVLMLPESAMVKAGDKTYTWRVKGSLLSKVDLQTGVRDQRTGNIEIKAGLAAGDTVLRNPSSNLKDGQKVELTGTAPVAGKTIASVATPQAKGN
jgi:membrane fusion protein (multidrug efflux system)